MTASLKADRKLHIIYRAHLQHCSPLTHLKTSQRQTEVHTTTYEALAPEITPKSKSTSTSKDLFSGNERDRRTGQRTPCGYSQQNPACGQLCVAKDLFSSTDSCKGAKTESRSYTLMETEDRAQSNARCGLCVDPQ